MICIKIQKKIRHMPESRKRGGKKAHNRRIVARNNYKKHEAKKRNAKLTETT